MSDPRREQEGGWWSVHWPASRVVTSFRDRLSAIELRNRIGAGVVTWGEELPNVV